MRFELTDPEFSRVVLMVSKRLVEAFKMGLFSPDLDDRTMMTQAAVINELCFTKDCIKREKKEVEAENTRLRITIDWLRETHRPIGSMEVKTNA